MINYFLIFSISLILNVIITAISSEVLKQRFRGNNTEENNTVDETKEKSRHSKLLLRYLIVYLLATLSDWLQGPYVYALYDAYGFSQHDIAVLFVAGFGSSMVFGSFVGGMADSGGRRRYVVLFCIIYALSCCTKHVKDYWVLMIGRLLGGIATSLLFSVFDSWLIRAHALAKLDKKYLSKSFSFACYGNSIIAIIAGLLANNAANYNAITEFIPSFSFYTGGYINPFDISLFALIICGICALTLWDENYGESENDTTSDPGNDGRRWTCLEEMKRAYNTTVRNRDILFCGIVSSFFEGSMYVFVFMWTPAMTKLESSGEEAVSLPFGLIFSTFMVCCMAGSSLFSVLVNDYNIKCETLAIFIMVISTLCFVTYTLSTSALVTFLSMNVFEMCVGMYFPTMGTMKSGIVPENQRSAIYNVYRIPLNFIVLFSLVTHLTVTQSFGLCVLMLAGASVFQIKLKKRREFGDPVGVQVQLVISEDEKKKMVSSGGGGADEELGQDDGNDEMNQLLEQQPEVTNV